MLGFDLHLDRRYRHGRVSTSPPPPLLPQHFETFREGLLRDGRRGAEEAASGGDGLLLVGVGGGARRGKPARRAGRPLQVAGGRCARVDGEAAHARRGRRYHGVRGRPGRHARRADGHVPKVMATFKQAQALAGGPLVQARNFAVMTCANAGISCVMRRIRGVEDVQGSCRHWHSRFRRSTK